VAATTKAGGGYTGPTWTPPRDYDGPGAARLRAKLRQTYQDPVSFGAAHRVPEGADAGLKPATANRIAWEYAAELGMKRLVELTMTPEQWGVGEFEDRPITDTEFEEGKQRATAQIRKDFAGKKVATRITPAGLAKVLDAGRFKTMFETQTTSASTYVPDKRAMYEEMAFGLPRDVDPTKRPIYGYLSDGVRSIDDDDTLLDTYGDVQVIFKDAIRSRTTATVGDSLDEKVLPSPVNDPQWFSFSGGMRQSQHGYDPEGADYLYKEAQIHNGVSIEDIEEVVFPKGDPPTAALQAALTKRGIPWRVL
jgi:hypothetical protein